MAEHVVTLELPNCQPTQATAVVVERTVAGRMLRAATILGALWGAAFVCVFIPLLHFVLVPVLLLLGPVMAALRLRERVSLQAVRGSCPRCLVERSFEASGSFTDGRRLHCDGCGEDLLLRSSTNAPHDNQP